MSSLSTVIPQASHVALEEAVPSEVATPPAKKIIPINTNDKAAMMFVFKGNTLSCMTLSYKHI